MVFDVFNNNAFGLVEMAKSVTRREHIPSGLGKYFTQQYIRSESIAIEFARSGLKLLQTTERGEPLQQRGKTERNIRNYNTTRIGEGTRIKASELDFIRGMGEEQAVMSVADEIVDRLGRNGTGQIGLLDDIDATMEHMYLGALQGKVLDADGSVIMDWSKEFDNATGMGGTGTIPTVAWDLAAVDGNFREQCNKVKREIIKDGGGSVGVGTKIVNLCGAEFFDTLVKMPEIREQFKNQQTKAMYVEGGDIFESVEYPVGVVWQEYRGTDDDTTIAVPTDECITFPSNISGSFVEVFAHGERFADLGMKGQRHYAHILRDIHDRYVDLEAMSYPLIVCTIPRSLRKGTIA